jgi:nucleoside-diphosphate-sugar epimerase
LNNLNSIQQNLNFKFIKGDILSPDLLMYVLETEQIDTVMHFAAQTHVDNSFGNSLAFTMNNTYGTHVLLEACRNYGNIKRFVNVSTDEVYGETSLGSQHGLNETSRLEPTNPYSAAKAGAEMMAMAYYTSYGMPVITTRGNNVYGPHQVRFWMLLLDACPDPSRPVSTRLDATRPHRRLFSRLPVLAVPGENDTQILPSREPRPQSPAAWRRDGRPVLPLRGGRRRGV